MKPNPMAVYLYHEYKCVAKRRGYSFRLTKPEFFKLTKMKCHYCGRRPRQLMQKARRSGKYIYNGIDRKSSKRGYTIKNSLPCCGKCNMMKGRLRYREFLNTILQIVSNLKQIL